MVLMVVVVVDRGVVVVVRGLVRRWYHGVRWVVVVWGRVRLR